MKFQICKIITTRKCSQEQRTQSDLYNLKIQIKLNRVDEKIQLSCKSDAVLKIEERILRQVRTRERKNNVNLLRH